MKLRSRRRLGWSIFILGLGGSVVLLGKCMELPWWVPYWVPWWACHLEFHDFKYCVCGRDGCNASNHQWDGCKCSKCGTVRPETHGSHQWNDCKCPKCGRTRPDEASPASHQW